MKFKTVEHTLHADSISSDVSLDEATCLNLYDDLLAFTDLSPDEQKAATDRTDASALLDPSRQPPVETPRTNADYEQRPTGSVEVVACEPPQTGSSDDADTSDEDGAADLQLAEILRVTGQLADFSTRHDPSSICADCGSPADGKDLFCITCGGSLEEVERAAPLSCGDCGSMIVSDEIFCPSCGSATLGA